MKPLTNQSSFQLLFGNGFKLISRATGGITADLTERVIDLDIVDLADGDFSRQFFSYLENPEVLEWQILTADDKIVRAHIFQGLTIKSHSFGQKYSGQKSTCHHLVKVHYLSVDTLHA